jgi:hypothetical protein
LTISFGAWQRTDLEGTHRIRVESARRERSLATIGHTMEKLAEGGGISQGLIWSPVWQPLETHIGSGDSLLLLISPFIGLEALRRFLQCTRAQHTIKVITRWRPEDVRAGVSDIEVYRYLGERGISLYINDEIHLKLYVFESNIAFSTSSNLTLRGFGYSDNANVEVGSFVGVTQGDWSKLFQLINTSHRVDDDIYQLYKRYVDCCPKAPGLAVPPPDLSGISKAYTISSLPAMESPVDLTNYYFAPDTVEHPPEVVRRAAHDLITLGVPPRLNHSEFNRRLDDSFRRTPFVMEFIEVLKAEKSLRFGAVNEWIHQKCEDVPLPYRWEIKDNTRIFYNWLQHFFPEISWDRPNYSQVIHWQGL